MLKLRDQIQVALTAEEVGGSGGCAARARRTATFCACWMTSNRTRSRRCSTCYYATICPQARSRACG